MDYARRSGIPRPIEETAASTGDEPELVAIRVLPRERDAELEPTLTR